MKERSETSCTALTNLSDDQLLLILFMSNIHTLNDTRRREAAEARQRQAFEQESPAAQAA
jgi:hypothetical protein